MDELRAYLEASDLGSPVAELALSATCALKPGTDATWHLVETTRGVVLAAATSETLGRAHDLVGEDSLRFVAGWTQDAVELAGATYAIPRGSGARARRLLGRGRIRAAATRPVDVGQRLAESPVMRASGVLAEHWLRHNLAPDEVAVAWLDTGDSTRIESPLLGVETVSWRLLVTDKRHCRVAIGTVGDVVVEPLAPAAWQVEAGLARAVVSAGDWVFRVASGQVASWRLVCELVGQTRDEQLRAVAAAVAGTAQEAVLGRLSEQLPLDHAVEHMRGGALADAVAVLSDWAADAGPDDLLATADRFGWTDQQRSELLFALLESGGRELALASLSLHRDLAERNGLASRDTVAQAAADVQLAEHALLAEQWEAARLRLAARLLTLPDETLDDVLPPPGADLTAGEGGQPLKVSVLELLAVAEHSDAVDPTAVSALARLQPLFPGRLTALAALPVLGAEVFGDVPLQQRAQAGVDLLVEGGLGRRSAPLPPAVVRRGLTAEELELLRHPLARSGGLFGWLQTRLARPIAPEAEWLRAYAQRLTAGPTVDALSDAVLALGSATPVAYVSHGERGVGVAAWSGEPPMLVVGGRHMEEGGALWLSPSELRFSVGSELAHLRYGHARVTSAALWAGAWDTSLAALDVLGTVLSMGGGRVVTAAVGRQATLAQVQRVVPAAALQRALGAGDQIGSWVQTGAGRLGAASSMWERFRGEPGAEGVGPRSEELLAAHRVLQLTADRAGLLLAGDLVSAVRALWLTDPVLGPELAVAERHGLVRALRRRGDDGAPQLQALAARLAALLSFWLSDDYAQLRAALGESA